MMISSRSFCLSLRVCLYTFNMKISYHVPCAIKKEIKEETKEDGRTFNVSYFGGTSITMMMMMTVRAKEESSITGIENV